MILGDDRKVVIRNIKKATEEGNFNSKVEVNDPKLSIEEKQKVIDKYQKQRNSIKYTINNKIARIITEIATNPQNKTTKIVGIENVKDIKSGAIITCNHFNQLDNIVIRKFAKKMGKRRLYIVGQDTNLAMTGFLGYMLYYMDVIPISELSSYMKKDFQNIIKEKLDKNKFVLIYPEQEMWFNYKKPRPLKKGAYYYAAKLNVPVISCFIEIREKQEKDNDEFYKVEYTLHILPTIYPNTEKSVKENALEMMEKDYNQKKKAYEEIYNEKLIYDFNIKDIAGFMGEI